MSKSIYQKTVSPSNIVSEDVIEAEFRNKEKIMLSDIETLTFIRGKKTTSRRLDPIDQLQCLGGNIDCSNVELDYVTCDNRGISGYGIVDQQWHCVGQMPNDYTFKSTEVSCEGYSFSGDPYILKGSCGLKYTLQYNPGGFQSRRSNLNNKFSVNPKAWIIQYGFLFIWLAIALFIIYKIILSCVRPNRTTSGIRNNQQPPHPPPPYSEDEYFNQNNNQDSYERQNWDNQENLRRRANPAQSQSFNRFGSPNQLGSNPTAFLPFPASPGQSPFQSSSSDQHRSSSGRNDDSSPSNQGPSTYGSSSYAGSSSR